MIDDTNGCVNSAASEYFKRGWSCVPIPAGAKAPTVPHWPTTDFSDTKVWFPEGAKQNIGLVLGDRSNGLVCVDLDTDKARELAPQFLPQTATGGRLPGSHWFFHCPRLESRKYSDPFKRTIIDVLSTGRQVIVHPSVHPTGAVYRPITGEVAAIEPDELIRCVEDLAEECGWQRPTSAKNEPVPRSNVHLPLAGTSDPAIVERARQYLRKLTATSGQGGHPDTLWAARVLVRGLLLNRADAEALLREWNSTNCVPPWSDKELAHKLDEAIDKPFDKPDGWLLNESRTPRPATGNAPATPWPELIPFGAAELPSFPTHVLPDVLRRWAEAESHATQTPLDLAGLLALAVCSAAIAKRVIIEPCDGWQEPANLFVTVVLEPGNRKTAVFADATKPLRELEGELIEAARPVVARAKSGRRQLEKRLERLERLAAGENVEEAAQARHEAEKLAEELAMRVDPVLPCLIVGDATAEKLGMILAEQGGRVASMSPEGNVFDLMAGRYTKNGAPQFEVYLKGHSGEDLKTDRVSRESVRVEAPAMTCGYTIQPDVIRSLGENKVFRDRGLLGRFLYAVPESWIGQREIGPAPVPADVREAYRQTVRTLAEVGGETVLGLTDDALRTFRDWEAAIETMLADGGAMERIRDWGAKLAGATLRIAASLHCVKHGAVGRIDESTIVAAIEIGRYLIPHAEHVLNSLATGRPGDDDARYVSRWIKRHERREFSKRDAQQDCRRRFPEADDIDPSLAELTRRGFIRPKPVKPTGPGRPPSPVFEVNPAVFADAEVPQKCTQYTQNSASEPEGGNSEDIEYAFKQPEPQNEIPTDLPAGGLRPPAQTVSIAPDPDEWEVWEP